MKYEIGRLDSSALMLYSFTGPLARFCFYFFFFFFFGGYALMHICHYFNGFTGAGVRSGGSVIQFSACALTVCFNFFFFFFFFFFF
jgi:hypothetical protein